MIPIKEHYKHYIYIFLLIQKGQCTCLGNNNQIMKELTPNANKCYAL